MRERKEREEMRRRWGMKRRSRTKKSRSKMEGGRGVKIGENVEEEKYDRERKWKKKRTIRRGTSSWCHWYGRVKMSQSLPST
jgi:hypothetical protein